MNTTELNKRIENILRSFGSDVKYGDNLPTDMTLDQAIVAIRALLSDVVRELIPERKASEGWESYHDHDLGFNQAIDELEAKAREMGLL